ncbi:MAG TPA: hypothetical protein VFH75_06775 [Actinomycetota bacterium]|nr:hypothetical protein [Actinomycetota bacterium]
MLRTGAVHPTAVAAPNRLIMRRREILSWFSRSRSSTVNLLLGATSEASLLASVGASSIPSNYDYGLAILSP